MKSSIKTAAARLRLVVIIVAALVLLPILAAELGLPTGGVHVEYRAQGVAVAETRLIATGTLVLLVVALSRLVQMLGLIAAGELFSVAVVRRFRGFAFWLLVMALFGLLAPILSGLAAPGPDGLHRVEIVFDLRQLLVVAVTMLLFLVARLLEQARALESEVGEFV